MRHSGMRESSQLSFFGAVTVVAVSLFAIVAVVDATVFTRFLGSSPPWLVAPVSAGVGMTCMVLLVRWAGFRVVADGSPAGGIGVAAMLATGFGLVAVAADTLVVRYPEDMNVPMPLAVAFYPAMGFVVEVFFHLLPLAILTALVPAFRVTGPRAVLVACLVGIALIEPMFQMALEAEPHPFTWIHVFLFNLAQLELFRRYGFSAMASLRIFYYVYWHMAWGVLRLHLLF
jgi:hypothetical protein